MNEDHYFINDLNDHVDEVSSVPCQLTYDTATNPNQVGVDDRKPQTICGVESAMKGRRALKSNTLTNIGDQRGAFTGGTMSKALVTSLGLAGIKNRELDFASKSDWAQHDMQTSGFENTMDDLGSTDVLNIHATRV